MAKISKRSVDALSCVEGRPALLWDEQLAGFGVKALPSGSKRYLVKYRVGGGRGAQQRWLMLGTHGQITSEQARALAQQALASVARGEDPQASKTARREAPTLRTVWLRFEAEQLPQKKAATKRDYEAQWRDLIEPRLGRSKVQDISRSDVDKFHKALRHAPHRANRTLALLSRLMSAAEAWEWRQQGTNPCRYVVKFPEKARTRYLSVEEIGCLGTALGEAVAENSVAASAANAIELLLLTGARLNEVLTAEWSWVDWKRGILSLPDSKTGAKPVYLGRAAIDLLKRQQLTTGEGAFIFPGKGETKVLVNLRKSWLRVCAKAGLDGVRLHDLRHTAASLAVGSGASLPIVGRLLGHSQAQTTMRYAHVDIDPALGAANQIGDIVTAAFPPKAGDASLD